MLTEQAAVAQMRMTDAEWILRRGPQTFRPTSTGMVREDGALYMLVADYEKVIAHIEAKGGAQNLARTDAPALPEPYDEVLIWWNSNSGVQRRVARLDAKKQFFQLSTYNCAAKSQYLAPVGEVLRWVPICDDGAA